MPLTAQGAAIGSVSLAELGVTVTPEEPLESVPVTLGAQERVGLTCSAARVLVRAADAGAVTGELVLPQTLEAPVELGQVVGRYVIRVGDETAAVADVTAAESVERLELFDVLGRFVKIMLYGRF